MSQLQGSLRVVEVVRLLAEVLDLLGHDPRAGGDHQLVVADAAAVVHLDPAVRLVDPDGAADLQQDLLVEEAALRSGQPLGTLAAHGDVHEAGLVDVLPLLVDERDARLVAIDLVAQLAHQQVGDERPPDAAAQDHNSVHGDAS